jgi:hypothetical protein
VYQIECTDDDMDTIAEFIDKAFKGADIKDEVINFNKQFPAIQYSFDQQLDLPNA